MPRVSPTYSAETLDALRVLGSQIGAARRELGWTAADLAARVGVSLPVISRIENGHPTTTIGTVFEAAVLSGVPLFGVDLSDPAQGAGAMSRLAREHRQTVALLPTRVRPAAADEFDDDF